MKSQSSSATQPFFAISFVDASGKPISAFRDQPFKARICGGSRRRRFFKLFGRFAEQEGNVEIGAFQFAGPFQEFSQTIDPLRDFPDATAFIFCEFDPESKDRPFATASIPRLV